MQQPRSADGLKRIYSKDELQSVWIFRMDEWVHYGVNESFKAEINDFSLDLFLDIEAEDCCFFQ